MRLSTIAGTTGSFAFPPSWIDNTLGTITYGVAYSDGVEADGSPTPTYSISSGALPTGLSLNSTTGAVTGTPNTAGSFSWQITATNTVGSVSQSFSRTVGTAPSWTDNTLAAMSYGVAYSNAVSASGTPAPTYSVSSGALPGGISLNSSTGAVTGTPNTAGSFSWTITATNGAGSVSQAFSQTIVLPLTVDFLVLAGGGGGGGIYGGGGAGGGGAGGYRTSVGTSGGGAAAEATKTLTAGTNYTVTVGAGGAGGRGTAPDPGGNGSKGSNSVFYNVTSTGGGYGSSYYNPSSSANQGPGGSGGSGGGTGGRVYGAGGAGTSGQGYAGGRSANTTDSDKDGGGGGGGAAGAGGNAPNNSGGNGGAGRASTITGSSVTRGGGGGGGRDTTNAGSVGSGGSGGGGNGGDPAGNGSANKGGGGGGCSDTDGPGGAGGKGIVILRYPSAYTITLGSGLTGSTSTVGSNKVTQITNGTGTVRWS